MSLRGRRSTLRKRSKRGFRGYPAATVAFYGPDDTLATKVAVGIVEQEGGDVTTLETWFTEDADVREDPEVETAVFEFITRHAAKTVVMTDGIIGCPHEETIDYPEGTSCPKCPFLGGSQQVDQGARPVAGRTSRRTRA
jgi:hypothetical protein